VAGFVVLIVYIVSFIGVPRIVSANILGGAGIGLLAYTWAALRCVYGNGVVQTTLKFAALGLVYSIAFSGTVALYAVTILFRM
jgi:hypothetical protein